VLLTINTVIEQWTEILITVDDQLIEYIQMWSPRYLYTVF